jgi:hypothetical protein
MAAPPMALVALDHAPFVVARAFAVRLGERQAAAAVPPFDQPRASRSLRHHPLIILH